MSISKEHDKHNRKFLSFLVVENNPMFQSIIPGLLVQLPYSFSVRIVGSGEEAIEQTQWVLFDLIFMNAGLPNIDGPEAAKIIKKQKGMNKDTPIIGVSSHHKRETDCINAGMAGFLCHEFYVRDIRKILEKHNLIEKN